MDGSKKDNISRVPDSQSRHKTAVWFGSVSSGYLSYRRCE